MKKALIVLAAISLLYGCTTFGNLGNLKKSESTQSDVTSLLGEPVKKSFEADQEVWQYRFVQDGAAKPSGTQTVLNLDVSFKDKAVDNYNITVTKETIPETRMQPGGATQPIQKPGQPAQIPVQPAQRGGQFINQFDRNGDGRVSKEEFAGPERVFRNLDRNNDGYIDASEAPTGQQRPRTK
jgi:hypothetical protein